MPKGGKLQPIKHPQRDLWIPNILDAIPKDDMKSMEHPMFALVGGDMRVREYEHRGNRVKLTPSAKGLATIKDKDVLIYLASQMTEALNRGAEISRTVRLTPHDLLVFTERDTSGWGYKRLVEAFHRLRNTSIETNIKTGNLTIEEGFGWIDDWQIVRYTKTGKMESVEVTLCKWLWHAISHREVLTISPDYFRLSRPIERRIYELCRKHCGAQKRWPVSMEVLHLKSGSTATLKEFRRLIKDMAEADHLPDYRLRYSEARDQVVVYARGGKGGIAQILDTTKEGGLGLDDLFVSKRKKKEQPGAAGKEAKKPAVRRKPKIDAPVKVEGEGDRGDTYRDLGIEGVHDEKTYKQYLASRKQAEAAPRKPGQNRSRKGKDKGRAREVKAESPTPSPDPRQALSDLRGLSEDDLTAVPRMAGQFDDLVNKNYLEGMQELGVYDDATYMEYAERQRKSLAEKAERARARKAKQEALEGEVEPPAPVSPTPADEPDRPVIEHPVAEGAFPAAAEESGNERPPEGPASADARQKAMDAIWAALGRKRSGSRD